MDVQIPKEEVVWRRFYNEAQELRFIITSKAARDFYFLYELRDEKFVKLGKDKNPKNLERKFLEKG